jgi:hypothetical protein
VVWCDAAKSVVQLKSKGSIRESIRGLKLEGNPAPQYSAANSVDSAVESTVV